MSTLLRVLLVTAALSAGCGAENRSRSATSDQDGASGVAAASDAEEAEEATGSAGTDLDELEGCDVVGSDEIAAALGSPVSEGESFGMVGCTWKGESGAIVQLQVFAGSALIPQTCDGQKFLVSGRQEEVAGLGDSAVWGTSGDLVVCSSTAVLKIDVEESPNPPDQDREVAVAIARAALAKLRA